MKKKRFFLGCLLALLVLLPGCVPEGAATVTLIADGETRTLVTDALTVRDVLLAANITLCEHDRVTPTEPTLVEDDMTIRVVRVEVVTETEEQEIPFERRTVRDATIPLGETRLLEGGQSGLEELIYRVTFEDGVEVDRQLLRRVTIQEPHDEIVLIGVQAEISPVPITGTVAYMANRNLWVMQTTSPNQRRLTDAGDWDGRVFALSPDGAYVLFTRVATDTEESLALNDLWGIETATSDAEPVQFEAEDVLWVGWAPDCSGVPTGYGCRVAYTTGQGTETSPGWSAENDLWIAWPRARDGRLFSSREIIEPSAGGTYGGWWGTTYVWGPDGQQLAYARADQVGVIRASTGAQTVLASFAPYRTFAPWVWVPTVSWSPTGDFIVSTLHGQAPTGESPEDSPVFDVHAISASGLFTAELVSEAGMWAAPAYASEGEAIVFGRARSPYVSQSSGYALYVMDSDGSDRALLFPPDEEVGLSYPEFAWGPGGAYLIVVYQGNLYMITVASGEVQQLTDEGGVTAVRWQW